MIFTTKNRTTTRLTSGKEIEDEIYLIELYVKHYPAYNLNEFLILARKGLLDNQKILHVKTIGCEKNTFLTTLVLENITTEELMKNLNSTLSLFQ